MTGTSNNLTNPYYATDAQQQQAYNQPPTGQQPNNINININHRNVPPPPPSGGLRVNISFGDAPIDVRRCARCCSETGTIVNYKYGSLIWIMCIVLFCFSVCLFWVPFCIDDWKDKEYRCANCSSVKGYRKGKLCWTDLQCSIFTTITNHFKSIIPNIIIFWFIPRFYHFFLLNPTLHHPFCFIHVQVLHFPYILSVPFNRDCSF